MSTVNDYINALERILTNDATFTAIIRGAASGPESIVVVDGQPVKTVARVISEVPSAEADRVAADAAAALASAQAGAAAGSATAAAGSAALAAQQAGVGAAAGRIYASTALGIASPGGVASGQYFYVPSTNSKGSYDVWLNNAGVAQFTTITLPSLAQVIANTASVADLANRAATLKFLPLSSGYDVDSGMCVDGVYSYWLDSAQVLHSNHTHDGLPDVPWIKASVLQMAGTAMKVLPLANGYDVDFGICSDGVYVLWQDSLQAMHSTHTHDGLSDIPALKAAAATAMKVLPLVSGYDVEWGVCFDGVYVGWFDAAGTFHSTHTHPEFVTLASVQAQVTQLQSDLQSGAVGGNAQGWLVEQVTSGAEQQVMVHDGTYRQYTPAGANWRAPIVHHNNIIRCLTDYFFAGQYEPCTILPTGEIIPESSVVAHWVIYGQSLALGSRGFMEDGSNNVLFGTVFTTAGSVHGELCSAFGSGGVGYPRIGTVFTEFGVIREGFAGGVLGETVCSSAINKRNDWMLANAHTRQRLLATSGGLGGTAYTGLKKGTSPYTQQMNAISGGKTVSNAKGYRYHVPVLFIIHGESETGFITDATYAGYLAEWLSDFTTDITAITSQRRAPLMLVSQMNRQKSTNEGVPLGQILAHENNAGIVLIGPKYQHRYYDDAHMLAEGYVKQGELAERAHRHWLAGRKWQPLKPVSVVKASNVVTIQFNNTPAGGNTVAGPVGALALDTTVVTNPGNYGFNCTDTGVTITGVALGGDGTSVVLTLSGTPAAGASIEYAMQSALNLSTMPSGQNTGSRGNLRDSDARDLSRFDNTPLRNWSVAFRKVIS